MMYSFHLKFSSTDPLKRWSFIYIPLVGGGSLVVGVVVGSHNHFWPKILFWGTFWPKRGARNASRTCIGYKKNCGTVPLREPFKYYFADIFSEWSEIPKIYFFLS